MEFSPSHHSFSASPQSAADKAHENILHHLCDKKQWAAYWATRPTIAHPSSSPLLGVCEALGRRYLIDPNVVRLAFVAACLGHHSTGLIIYLACALCFPRGGTEHGEGPIDLGSMNSLSRPSRAWWWPLVAVGLVILISDSPNALSSVAGIFITLAFLLITFARYSTYPLPPVSTPPPMDFYADRPYDPTHTGRWSPDPLGSQWYPLDDSALNYSVSDPLITTPHRPERSAWPIIILGIIGLIIVQSVAVFGASPSSDMNIGSIDAEIKTYEDLQESYSTHVGSIELDLRSLPPLDRDRNLDLSTSTGTIEVLIPRGMNTSISCSVNIGTFQCPGSSQVEGQDKGPTLFLTATTNIGEITITRA
ncbi:PspC domain-containing protein [Corynebacterium sp. ES2715-CONJ3]|uniref:PspC domain-containing protein n=1 Tax=Corynebacterium sp. ES2715-CONJ3 TaxID=2974028 RepID=UPI002169206E|nr:PspC domain-containing protein [Corynebacterium sp. ES2715-CONJ3]MCS4491431.1 PspC domain-containing protein [Corynebacterium sp. ES2715-CONJ3]